MGIDVGTLGIWVSSRQWPSDASARSEAAAEIEQLGFGALWLGGASGDLELPEALLAATTSLVVATGIVRVWTDPADVVAASYARVSKAYPERMLLGIGAGHAGFVEKLTGRRYERPYSELVRYLDALDAAGEPVAPGQRVLAALGPRVLELAGRRTAGAHPYLVTPEHTRRAREILGAGPLLAPEQMVVLSTDATEARAVARAALKLYLGLPNYTNNLLRLGFTDDDLAGDGSDRFVDELVAWGDVDAVLARVAEHRDAGADHVCIQVLTGGPKRLPREQWRALSAAFGSR